MLPIQGDANGSRIIRWNNSGSRLATVDQDQAIRIWDTSDGHLLGILDDHIDSIYDVAWSPDGALLASAAWDGNVYVWNATTFETVGDFQMPNARFSSIDWGPTNLIAVSSGQQIYIIDPSTTDLVQTIGGSTDTIRTLKWSPDGTLLASAAGQVISLWDGTNFQFEDTLVGHLNFILDLAWRPDSGTLASTSGGNSSLDNSVYVWNTSTGEISQSIKGHTGSIETLSWVSNNEQIGSGSLGGEISIWDATEAELITTIPLAANNIGWNTNETLLAGSYVEQLRIWDWTDLFDDSLSWQNPPSSGSLEYVEMSYDNITNDFMSLMWNPDGEQIAIGTADGFARILNSLTGNVLSSLEHDSQVVWRIAWSPDGQQVVTSANDITIWDAASEAEVATLDPFTGTFWQLAWSPDGERIVGGTIEGDTVLWNTTDHHMLWVTSDGIQVNALAWHPSGNILAIGKNDGTIVLVDANTNIEITTLTGHNGPVTALAWNSDGTQLASGGEDGTIRIWANK